jgi:hypothetical protein
MNKFFEWVYAKRKAIGYTVGGLNVLAAVNYAFNGQTGMAVLWTVIGLFLIWDAYEFK